MVNLNYLMPFACYIDYIVPISKLFVSGRTRQRNIYPASRSTLTYQLGEAQLYAFRDRDFLNVSEKFIFQKVKCYIESLFTRTFTLILLILKQFWKFLRGQKLHSFLHYLVDFSLNCASLNNLNIAFSKMFCLKKPMKF